jgi:hypothetical protein
MNVTPLRERGRRHLEEAGEYQKKHVRAGNGPAESSSNRRNCSLGLSSRWVATNPECKVQRFFKQVIGRWHSLAGEVYSPQPDRISCIRSD